MMHKLLRLQSGWHQTFTLETQFHWIVKYILLRTAWQGAAAVSHEKINYRCVVRYVLLEPSVLFINSRRGEYTKVWVRGQLSTFFALRIQEWFIAATPVRIISSPCNGIPGEGLAPCSSDKEQFLRRANYARPVQHSSCNAWYGFIWNRSQLLLAV